MLPRALPNSKKAVRSGRPVKYGHQGNEVFEMSIKGMIDVNMESSGLVNSIMLAG